MKAKLMSGRRYCLLSNDDCTFLENEICCDYCGKWGNDDDCVKIMKYTRLFALMGYEVVTPLQLFSSKLTWAENMIIRLKELSKCDVMFCVNTICDKEVGKEFFRALSTVSLKKIPCNRYKDFS